MISIIFALGALLAVIGWILLLNARAYNRAVKRGVIWYKHGMAVDEKGRLLGTSTPVYRDPKTGATFLGKTKFGTDGGF